MTGPPICTRRASLRGIPTSRAVISASSSARASRASAIAVMSAARSAGVVTDQVSNARRAAATPASMSAGLPAGTVAMTDPSAAL